MSLLISDLCDGVYHTVGILWQKIWKYNNIEHKVYRDLFNFTQLCYWGF